MYDLEKNVEYLIIGFVCSETLLEATPLVFNYLTKITSNPLYIYGETIAAAALFLLVSIFFVKYCTIPITIRMGKFFDKLI